MGLDSGSLESDPSYLFPLIESETYMIALGDVKILLNQQHFSML